MNHRKKKHKKFKSPEIVYEEQDEKEERIIEQEKMTKIMEGA